MKKLWLILFSIPLFAQAQAASVTILNTSAQNDMEVHYRLSNTDSNGNQVYSAENIALIKAKKSAQDKNYIVLNQPPRSADTNNATLEVTQVIETNNGKTVATGNFLYTNASNHAASTCASTLYTTNNPTSDSILSLNSMHTSYVLCMHKGKTGLA